MQGDGRFQWSTGGWFGGQLGGTSWLLVGAAVLSGPAPEVALVWLVCFTVANVIGYALWARRDRLRPYPAIQSLMAVCGVCGVVAILSLHGLRPGLQVHRPPGFELEDDPRLLAALVGIIVVVMVKFSFSERMARRERMRAATDPSSQTHSHSHPESRGPST
jgi:hypothetical protein